MKEGWSKSVVKKAFSAKPISLVLATILPQGLYSRYVSSTLESVGSDLATSGVLCLGRSLFRKDFEEFSSRSLGYTWHWLDAYRIAAYQERALPKEAKHQTRYIKTLVSHDAAWDLCLKKTRIFLQEVTQRKNIKCIVTANIDYWQDHSVKIAASELNIPVVVLSKENVSTLTAEHLYNDLYRDFRANVSGIAVFSDRLLRVFSELGLGRDAALRVTGAPRLDRWRSLIDTTSGKLVTLFSYRQGYGTGASENFFEDVHQLLDFASSHSDYRVLIKAKDLSDRQAIIAAIKGNVPSNVIVDDRIGVYDAALNSRVIIGYNSLSLVETMISDRPILTPVGSLHRDETILDPENPIHRSAVQFYHPGALRGELERALDAVSNARSENAQQKEAREYILNEVLSFDRSRSSSERFVEFLEYCMQGQK